MTGQEIADAVLSPLRRHCEEMADLALAHARHIVRSRGEPVIMRGQRWYDVRRARGELKRAVDFLERYDGLKRWPGEKGLVRIR